MTHWTECLDTGAPDGAYLSWRKVEPRVGISRTTAWRLQKSGEFPRPYVISPGRVAYRESEVEAWRRSRAHRSNDAPPVPGRRGAGAPAAAAVMRAPVPSPRPAPAAPAAVVRAAETRPGPVNTGAQPSAGGRNQITFDF